MREMCFVYCVVRKCRRLLPIAAVLEARLSHWMVALEDQVLPDCPISYLLSPFPSLTWFLDSIYFNLDVQYLITDGLNELHLYGSGFTPCV